MASSSKDFVYSQNMIKSNWNNLMIGTHSYLFKAIFEDSKYEIMIFDLNDQFRLYYSCKNEKEIEDLFKGLNPYLDAPLNKILDHLKDTLFTSGMNKNEIFSASIDDIIFELRMQSKLSNVKFNWIFELEQLDSKLIRDHVVFPLIFNSTEYQLREQELLKVIRAKDKEIEDYKAQGVKLSRPYLSTDTFNLEIFDDSISKKNEIREEFIEQPERCLYTAISHKINKSCSDKYYDAYFKRTKIITNEQILNESHKSESQTGTDKNASKSSSTVLTKDKISSSSSSSSQNQISTKQTNKDEELKSRESRMEELEQKLKEEETKDTSKKSQIKKKKLF